MKIGNYNYRIEEQDGVKFVRKMDVRNEAINLRHELSMFDAKQAESESEIMLQVAEHLAVRGIEEAELGYALAYGDVVYIPSENMEVIRYYWGGDHKQIFLNGAWNGPVSLGWEEPDGSLPEGVGKGKYWVCSEYNQWSYQLAYWQPNVDLLTPYEAGDFEVRETGFFSRYN